MRTLLVFALLAPVAGCKDKPTRKAPPQNIGSASSSRPSPDLALPHSDGSPLKRTTKPLTKDDYQRLAKLTFPGFEAMSRDLADNTFEIYQTTKDHPKLAAVITIQPCADSKVPCIPMELDRWRARTEDLKVYLGALKDKPGVEFEVGQTAINGQPIIYTYQLGASIEPGAGGGALTFTDAYIAYYNDGVNQVRVLGAYKDDPIPKEQLLKTAPKQDLQALALAFLDVYTHAW